jgi:hypothetical protein
MQYPVPERDLHHAENTKDDEFRVKVFWKLFSWIEQQLVELWYLLPNKYHRSEYLDGEQQQIYHGLGHSPFVFIDIGSTNDEKRMQV